MTLDSRSGVFTGKTDETKFVEGSATSLGGALLTGVSKGWPLIRHRITGKTLVSKFGEPTKNQQDYYQISANLKIAKEADIVRYVADDARYPVIQTLAYFASLIVGDLTYKAVLPGTGSNAITIENVVAGNDTPLSIDVTANAITINLATDAGGLATSTADEIKALFDSTPTATALATCTVSGTGTTVQAVFALDNLAGGAVPDIELSADPYTLGPETITIGGSYGLKLFIIDGSDGLTTAITIENRVVLTEQFDLVVWSKSPSAVYTEVERHTVSVRPTGVNSKNGDGETIFIESFLLNKNSIVGARVKDNVIFDEIPEITAKTDFIGGSAGSVPTEPNLLAAAAVLKNSTAKLIFLAGISSPTAIDSIATDCKNNGAQCFADVPFSNSKANAITWAAGLAANENLAVYFNAIRCDDYLLQGRTVVGHSGHAAAMCSYGDTNSPLKTGRAPAGEEFGTVSQWKNVELYNDLSDTDLNDLADARINVAIPNTNTSFGPVMFNDQYNRYGIKSDFELIHVQRTIDYINQSFANALSSAVHDDPKSTKEKVDRATRDILEPMVVPDGSLVVAKDGSPPFEVIQGESETESGVYEVTPRVSIVKAMRQISLNTHSI